MIALLSFEWSHTPLNLSSRFWVMVLGSAWGIYCGEFHCSFTQAWLGYIGFSSDFSPSSSDAWVFHSFILSLIVEIGACPLINDGKVVEVCFTMHSHYNVSDGVIVLANDRDQRAIVALSTIRVPSLCVHRDCHMDYWIEGPGDVPRPLLETALPTHQLPLRLVL